jgi:hypothetical protein
MAKNNALRRTTGSILKMARTALRAARAVGKMDVERKAQRLSYLVKSSDLVIDDTDGYTAFSASDFGLGSQIANIAALANDWKGDSTRNGGDKPFLINLLKTGDLFNHLEFLEVALNPVFYGAVTKYLGQVPRLVSMSVWLSPPNQTAVRSQLYHYDHKDTRQAKIFINLNDVTAECGPLHFLPVTSSKRVEKAVGYSQGRYTDEEVYGAVSASEAIAAVGGVGRGYIVDTARCLHYGSRENTKERLVMMVNFARANCVDPGSGCEVLDPVRSQVEKQFYSDDEARAFSVTSH